MPNTSVSGVDRDRRTLRNAALVVGLLAALTVLPYVQYVLAAGVLAYVLYPLQQRLERRVGRTLAAGVVVVLATAAIIVPIAVLLAVAVQQGLELADAVAEGELGFETIEEQLLAYGLDVDLASLLDSVRDPIESALRGLTGEAAAVLGGVPEFLIGLTIMVFVLYSLLRDGDRFARWVRSVTPLRAPLQDELRRKFDRILWASIVGNAAVAAVQAILTVIGLAIVGISNLVFFGIFTFILALLPLVGATVVWAPASLYLALIGRPLSAAFLFIFGAVVVSVSDNVLRPITVGRGAELSVAIVIVGIFGGVALLGAVGLFVGPVILGAAKVVFEVYARERGQTGG